MPFRDGTGPRWWHKQFKRCGYRITFAREIILDLLSKSKKHLSAEDIYMIIHKQHPSIGLTTVYRTLDILVNMNFVHRFDFGDKRARYELSSNSDKNSHHHHLVCTQCNKVIDYDDFIEDEIDLLRRTEKGLSKKYNFEIKDHLIQFYGLCQNCKNKR